MICTESYNTALNYLLKSRNAHADLVKMRKQIVRRGSQSLKPDQIQLLLTKKQREAECLVKKEKR